MDGRPLGLGPLRVPQPERPEREVHVMAAKVAERPAAEVPPSSPLAGQVARMVRPMRRRAEPQVPVQVLRHGRGLCRALVATVAGTGPDVDLVDGADRTGPDEFHDPPVVVAGVNLGADLGGHLLLAGQVRHDPRLLDRVRQRLLAVDVLAHPKGHGRGRGMRVVRRRDDDGVDAAVHLAKHPAEVSVAFGLGVLLGGLGKVMFVHIAEGDDVLAADAAQVGPAPAGHADDGDGEFLVGRRLRPADPQHQRPGQHGPGGGGRALQESAACQTVRHGYPLPLRRWRGGLRRSTPCGTGGG